MCALADNDKKKGDDRTYYISRDGQVHTSPQDALRANEASEATDSRLNTGGNCGQSADNLSVDKDGEKDEKK